MLNRMLDTEAKTRRLAKTAPSLGDNKETETVGYHGCEGEILWQDLINNLKRLGRKGNRCFPLK